MGNELRSAVIEALQRYSERQLLADDRLSLTGADIERLISPLVCEVRERTEFGDAVGIYLPNSLKLGLALIAIVRAGRVPVIYKAKESFERVVCRPMSLLIHDQSQSNPEIGIPSIKLGVLSDEGLDFQLAANSAVQFDGRVASLAPVPTSKMIIPGTGMILYTSGSSGESKGVMIPAKGTLSLAGLLRERFKLGESTISPIILPLAHTMCINTHFFPTFLAGGLCRFVPISFGMGQIYRSILETRGDFVAVINELIALMAEEQEKRNLPLAEHVRTVQISGGIITETELNNARRLFPNATLYKGYGLTEATRVAMIASDTPDFASTQSGYPLLPGVEIEIRGLPDSENCGLICSPGQRGEIFIKSPTLMLGYFGKTEQPFDERGFLRTGDIGEIGQEGRLKIYDRADGIFKINGEIISATQIEGMALKLAGGAFRGAKCLPFRIENRSRLCVFVEAGSHLPSPHVLRRVRIDLKRKLRVGVKLVPVVEFPRLPNGKVHKQELVREGVKLLFATQCVS